MKSSLAGDFGALLHGGASGKPTWGPCCLYLRCLVQWSPVFPPAAAASIRVLAGHRLASDQVRVGVGWTDERLHARRPPWSSVMDEFFVLPDLPSIRESCWAAWALKHSLRGDTFCSRHQERRLSEWTEDIESTRINRPGIDIRRLEAVPKLCVLLELSPSPRIFTTEACRAMGALDPHRGSRPYFWR